METVLAQTGTLLGLTLLASMLAPHGAAATEAPAIQYNKDYVEDVTAAPAFDIDDRMAVLAAVLADLPDRVAVYPTENYFYFSFHHKGVRYAGNLRFDIADRDEGRVHFSYFREQTEWRRDDKGVVAILGPADGVTLRKAGPLSYDLAFRGKTVRFDLNDLGSVEPPKGMLRPEETYIGPVFDESAIRFFLVFDRERKVFLYLLDETVATPETFFISGVSDRISIGTRTGFAFYADRLAGRKILIGVNRRAMVLNTPFDGPFDQLPDNFIKGDTLSKAIVAETPDEAGQIDRFGNSSDGETRYLIAPYMHYDKLADLAVIVDCTAKSESPRYYDCFSGAGRQAK